MIQQTNELDILNEGRRAVAVVFKDGSSGEVTVKKVGLVDMPKLHAAQSDIAKEAVCYVEDATPESIELILEDSLLDVVEAGQEINDPLFLRWLKQRERNLKMRGIDLDELRAAVAKDVLEAVKDLPASEGSLPS